MPQVIYHYKGKREIEHHWYKRHYIIHFKNSAAGLLHEQTT